MKRCVLFGESSSYVKYHKMLQYYVCKNEIEICGIISKTKYCKSVMEVDLLSWEETDVFDFDYVIVLDTDIPFASVLEEIIGHGIGDDRIVPAKVMGLPGFDFEKYGAIKRNVPTIICPNCWGGILYNTLCLEFRSPFINMFESHDDYLKIVRNLDYYLNEPLVLDEMKTISESGKKYPVVRCGDVLLHFNHSVSFEAANVDWERRKKRVDKTNMFFMLYDGDADRINQFLALPHDKKVCFTPFLSDKKNVFSMDYTTNAPNEPFWKIVNESAKGYVLDVFELLLNNEMVMLSRY